VDDWHLAQIIFLRQTRHLFKKKFKTLLLLHLQHIFFLAFCSVVGVDAGIGGDGIDGEGVDVDVCGDDEGAGGDGGVLGGGGEDEGEELLRPVKDKSPSPSS
jgi:hypothetical protein